MKCECCNEQMQFGYLECRDIMYWTKDAKAIKSPVYKDNVIIGKHSFLSMNGNSIKAYICKNCKRILVDYND